MIFGRVMALGLWNLAKYFAMLGDIDLIFGIWVYNDELNNQATLLNIHDGDIRVVSTHLFLFLFYF
jgi:hypothetical protein